jgi:hypothetical protein
MVSDISNIEIYDENIFEKIYKNDVLKELRYMVDEPYYLYVEVDFEENELVIEFTGKILGKDYPKLISNETIYQCFDVINSNGAFSVAPEMLMNSVVVKCDVTFDIAWDGISNFTEYVRNNLTNYQKYICRRLKNGNLVIEKNVTTRQYKKRLEIYDKGSEMSLIKNRSFLNYYFDGDNPFIGMCRFELNLNSKNQIRKSLCVSDCILHNVLASMQNPIVDFLNEILIKNDDSVEVSDWKSYQMKLVLEDCNYDLQMVEAKLRQYYSKGNNFFKIMKPYRELLLSSKSSMIRKTLFDKLTMC